MATRAQHRIQRLSVYIVASGIVIILAAILWIKIGWPAARIVLQGIGIVAIAMFAGDFATKNWIWKSAIGRRLGFPPNYSGKWSGTVSRIKMGDSVQQQNRVEVRITQSVTHIDWHQVGYSDSGQKISESHFILGEVIDEHRSWDAILGVYEVQRQDGSKDSGMSFVRANEANNEISGVYCGLNGHVGTIAICRVQDVSNDTKSTNT